MRTDTVCREPPRGGAAPDHTQTDWSMQTRRLEELLAAWYDAHRHLECARASLGNSCDPAEREFLQARIHALQHEGNMALAALGHARTNQRMGPQEMQGHARP